MNAGTTLRALLATQGIFYDEPAGPSPTATPSRATSPEPVDRELVREILVDRGAPAEALAWLTDSCPSVEAAREFEPTPAMRRSIAATDDFGDYLKTDEETT